MLHWPSLYLRSQLLHFWFVLRTWQQCFTLASVRWTLPTPPTTVLFLQINVSWCIEQLEKFSFIVWTIYTRGTFLFIILIIYTGETFFFKISTIYIPETFLIIISTIYKRETFFLKIFTIYTRDILLHNINQIHLKKIPVTPHCNSPPKKKKTMPTHSA